MYNSNIALNEQQPLLDVIRNDNYTADIINESERKKYEEILLSKHNCNFNDEVWEINETFKDTPSKINFKNLDFLLPEELNVVKCFVINKLAINSERSSSLNNHLHELKNFFTYLHKEKIKLKSFNTEIYALYLKEKPESKINSFIEFLNLENIINVSVKKSKHHKSKNRTAIEQAVIEQLDVYFFNLDGKNNIPTDIRAIYLTLRFICNRISEVLHMKTDCIQDINENYFSIVIPNTKSTARHAEKYVNYYISSSGEAETIFRKAIEEQIKYAAEHNDNRLFISRADPNKTVKDHNFNDFIAAICEKENICNADGTVAAPTSHQFRHNAVTERINSGLYSRKMLKEELNHNSINSQLTYYGKSAYDRFLDDKELVDTVYSETSVDQIFDGRNKQIENIKVVPKFQYDKLIKSPSIRYLPENQLCSACSCKPRFESCVACDNFVPDPQYYEDVAEIVAILKEKLDQIKKAGLNKPAEDIIQKQIDTYKLYLKKVEKNNEKTN